MLHSLIAKPIANTTAKVWKFLDFSADLKKSIAGFMANSNIVCSSKYSMLPSTFVLHYNDSPMLWFSCMYSL